MSIEPAVVIGADGAIGGALFDRLKQADGAVVGTSRRVGSSFLHLDLEGEPRAWQLPDRANVAYLCAAAASLDGCRQQPAQTRRINVEGTLEAAKRLRDRGAHVVFLSTNQVFDGIGPRQPALARPNPQTEYGRQKAETERELLASGQATVVRFTKVLGPSPPLFRSWLNALRKGEPIEPFHDMAIAPIPLTFAVDVLKSAGDRRLGGVVQASGEMDISYAEIARALAARLQADPDLIRPISIADRGVSREAAPWNTTLDASRIEGLGLTPPPVWDTIAASFEDLVHA
jgi:dTDP-4-dehydrorhamnose reductase